MYTVEKYRGFSLEIADLPLVVYDSTRDFVHCSYFTGEIMQANVKMFLGTFTKMSCEFLLFELSTSCILCVLLDS